MVTGQVQDLQSSIEWERLSAELRCRQLDSQLSRERSEASKNQEMTMRMGRQAMHGGMNLRNHKDPG